VGNVRITDEHFEHALGEVSASVDEGTRERYEQLEEQFGNREPDSPDEGTVSRTFQ